MLGHAEPVITAIAANAGVAPKLLWNNVAAYLSWILKEIAHRHEPALVEGGLALLNDAEWPGGGRNPMFGMIRMARQQCGLEFARRKVCCLRYNLPGVGGCGEACPLPDRAALTPLAVRRRLKMVFACSAYLDRRQSGKARKCPC